MILLVMPTLMALPIIWMSVLTARETYNQFQDEDGCPDTVFLTIKGSPVDTDGDGIVLIMWTSCPTQPETFNGLPGQGRLPRYSFSSTLRF